MKVMLEQPPRGGRGFSMVEVNLAILILALGLIMVATIFPVGADYTRQNAEETISQTIARNAIAIMQTRLDATDFSGIDASTTPPPTQLQSIRGTAANTGLLAKVPASSRAYNFGASNPTPVATPSGAQYFWTALARLSPGSTNAGAGAIRRYDVYIFVFKKGAVEHEYKVVPGSTTFVDGCRVAPNDPDPTKNEDYIPFLVSATFATSPAGSEVPPPGGVGVGINSGTVFRMVRNASGTLGARPGLINGEPVIVAPAADGTATNTLQGTSPLVFVYQTSLSY